MLIFTLPSWYKTEKHPENCVFIFEQMKALEALGHKVVVLSVQPAPVLKAKADKSIRVVNDDGITTYYTEIPVLKPSSFRQPYISGFKKALLRLILKATEDCGEPDILYAHFSFAAGRAAVDISKKLSIPLVVEEHYSGLMSDSVDKALILCVRETAERADGFICVSDGLREAVIEKTGTNRPLKVISNMINPCFKYFPKADREGFVFFSCGNLLKRKRFDLLIRAFAEAFSDDDKVELRIGGSGEEENALKNLCDELKVTDKVTFLGHLTREDTLREYIYCDAFALPSAAETYGLVYREALAVGRPVISTRHGGFSDDWSDDFGYLIDVDNKEQLVSALKNMRDNIDSYSPENISRLCLSYCSESAVAEMISDYLSETAKNYKR